MLCGVAGLTVQVAILDKTEELTSLVHDSMRQQVDMYDKLSDRWAGAGTGTAAEAGQNMRQARSGKLCGKRYHLCSFTHVPSRTNAAMTPTGTNASFITLLAG